MLNRLIDPHTRSLFYQATLRLARRIDPANRQFDNLDAPILLLGSARGGTTLLANIVGAHPLVYIFHERFTPGKESYSRTFGATSTPSALRGSFVQFIPHSVKSNRSRWGVKITAHIWTRQDLDRFIESCPRLQVVFVIRDGRDTVLSILKRSPYIKSAEEAFERWIESVQVFDYLKSKLYDRFFWYYYEELVKDPAPKVRQICDFLGLPFDPGMIDRENWPGLGSYEIAPISADKVEKWKRETLPAVSPDLTQRFEQVLRHAGYVADTVAGQY